MQFRLFAPTVCSGRSALPFVVPILDWRFPENVMWSAFGFAASATRLPRLMARPMHPWTSKGLLTMRRLPIPHSAGRVSGPSLSRSARSAAYVARADTTIFNQASQVILVRDGDRTVLTMANDFKGDPKEFAVVIPVRPSSRVNRSTSLRGRSSNMSTRTAPRLVEPTRIRCRVREMSEKMAMPGRRPRRRRREHARQGARRHDRGPAQVGEYDIVILSAAQSSGLETWLTSNGYRMPTGAAGVLGSYTQAEACGSSWLK